MFGMNHPDVLVGYVQAEVGFGASIYKQGFYACVTEDCFNNKGMFI